MLRYGRKTTKYLRSRAMRRLRRQRWTYFDEKLTTRQRKAAQQLHRKLLSIRETLAAIKAAKADKVTVVSFDAL